MGRAVPPRAARAVSAAKSLHAFALARYQRMETIVLVVLGLIAGALWLFIELADAVVEGHTRTIDTALLLAMRTPGNPADPWGPLWLQEVARDFTALGGVAVLSLLTLAVIGYLAMAGKRHAALAVFIAVVGGQILSSLLKLGFHRPRPDLVPHLTHVYTASFPSGHSLMAAVTYLTLGALLASVQASIRIKVFFLTLAAILTVLIGVSRVYLGVHWPSDVVAGWAVGAAWALLCWLVTRWLQRRGAVEGETR
jgi:undecaprenyl-diphosphatase